MFTILLVIYLLAAIGVIGLVLVQQGKGADMGASFGAGASNTVFGAGGSGNFLTRSTAVLATVFFVLSLALGNLSTHKDASQWAAPVSVSEEAAQQKTDKSDADAAPAEKTVGDEIPQ